MTTRALLVANGGGLGDALLATVVARALRSRFDVVDALVLPSQAGVVTRVPEIAETLIDDGASAGAWAERLRPRGYAASVTTWATPRLALAGLLARIPIRVGQARRLYSHLFTNRVVVRSERGDETSRWTDILLDYARALDCDAANAVPAFVPTANDMDEARTVRAALGLAQRPYALLHPTRGIAHARDRWPTVPFTQLVERLGSRYDVEVLVTGSDADAPIAEAVVAGTSGASIAGRTSIGAFAALARDAAFVVAMDSGPMHVAAAVGAPTVGIFALRSDRPDRWGPQGRATAVVRGSFPCPPKHRKETCPDFACIAALPEGRIVDAVDGVLGRIAKTRSS